MDIEKFIRHSQPVSHRDLDWDLARRVGLSSEEQIVLRYFCDVEGQTIFYLRELLGTSAARDENAIVFLTMWNYEEFFHSWALRQLLDRCSVPESQHSVVAVRSASKRAAALENLAQHLLARLIPETFLTLYLAWGASQEALTLRGYERIAATTSNPVVRELCVRVAKQERRHFAWYYNSAKERLERSRFARVVVRVVFERFWSPVGVGVKTDDQAAEVINILFADAGGQSAIRRVDDKIAKLPGLCGLNIVSKFFDKAGPGTRTREPVTAS